ncbi:TldD/PmbA family protein [Candidatus Hodarchaeum mangrovi]
MFFTDYPGLAEKLINRISNQGLEAEVYFTAAKRLHVSIEQNSIKSEREEITQGFTFRVVKGKQKGLTYSNSTNINTLMKTGDIAVKIANKSPEDPNWSGFTLSQSSSPVQGIYDKEIAHLSSETILESINMVILPITIFGEKNNIEISTRGQFSLTTELSGIINTNGVNCQEKSSRVTLNLGANCRRGEEVSGGIWDVLTSRRFNIIDKFDDFSQDLAQKTILNLGAQKIPEMKGEILLEPNVIAMLCRRGLISALSAENIHNKRSPFVDRIGDYVFNSNLTLVDDGRLSNGLYSSTFDAEGVPRQKTILANKGYLKGYLFDNYYSNIFDTTNTGNSARSGYTSRPYITGTNFFLEVDGKLSLEESIQDIKEGAIIGDFSGNVNMENGEFSGVCKISFAIENGEFKFPLKDTTIAGNFYKVLSDAFFLKEPKDTYYGVRTPACYFSYNLKK